MLNSLLARFCLLGSVITPEKRLLFTCKAFQFCTIKEKLGSTLYQHITRVSPDNGSAAF